VSTPSGQEIGIGIPNADTARPATRTSSGTTIYTNPASNSATAVQVIREGVRQLFTLSNHSAPTAFVIPLRLPAGVSLYADGAGGYYIASAAHSGRVTTTDVHIEAPWARDALGRSLHTIYTVEGNQLTQHIDTSGATFPVVADPSVSFGWYIYVHLSGKDQRALVQGGIWGSGAVVAALTCAGLTPIGVAICGGGWMALAGILSSYVSDYFSPGCTLTLKFSYGGFHLSGHSLSGCH
jgi:hypothetical protein